MTARPLSTECRRWPLIAAVALVLLAMVMAAGCINGKTVPEFNKENSKTPAPMSLTTTNEYRDIAITKNSVTVDTINRNSSCPKTSYQPVLLLGDNVTTRILGHEEKTVNISRIFCTEFDPRVYTISFNSVPLHVMKFDFAEFDQQQIFSKIREDQEISVWIRGKNFRAMLKEMNFNAKDIGIYSYSGKLEGEPQSEVILTISKNTTIGSLRLGNDEFYIEPVGMKKDTAGNTSPVTIIYAQKDVEDYSFSLANDVMTVPMTGGTVKY